MRHVPPMHCNICTHYVNRHEHSFYTMACNERLTLLIRSRKVCASWSSEIVQQRGVEFRMNTLHTQATNLIFTSPNEKWRNCGWVPQDLQTGNWQGSLC